MESEGEDTTILRGSIKSASYQMVMQVRHYLNPSTNILAEIIYSDFFSGILLVHEFRVERLRLWQRRQSRPRNRQREINASDHVNFVHQSRIFPESLYEQDQGSELAPGDKPPLADVSIQYLP